MGVERVRSWLEMKPFLRSRMEAVGVVILVFFVCVWGLGLCGGDAFGGWVGLAGG